MQNIYPAVKAIITGRDKFLVIRHVIDGIVYWDLPGGKIEYGEDPYETLVREVKEEIGLDVDIKKPVGMWWFIRKKDKAQIVCTTFLCTAKNRKIKIRNMISGENIEEFKWLTKEEFLSESYTVGDSSLKKMIEKIEIKKYKK